MERSEYSRKSGWKRVLATKKRMAVMAVAAIAATVVIRLTLFTEDCNLLVLLFTFTAIYACLWCANALLSLVWKKK